MTGTRPFFIEAGMPLTLKTTLSGARIMAFAGAVDGTMGALGTTGGGPPAGTLVDGGLVTGGFVTGGFVTGGFVTGGTTELAAGVPAATAPDA